MPKYDIEIELSGKDGNAHNLIGLCRRKMRRYRDYEISNEEIEKFTKEATAGDYQNVLSVCREWFIIN